MTSDSSTGRRKRNDPRREQTRVAIIEKAESLFAEHGIDGVSLRKIGSAIGSANISVVAYHFGSKDNLVESIFHHRLPAFEKRRQTLLADLSARGSENDVYALLRALWLPLFEQVGEDGCHGYAGFVSALMRSQWAQQRALLNTDYPVTTGLIEKLQSLVPETVRPLFQHRLNLCAVTISGALALIDRRAAESGISADDAAALFDDALQMTGYALLAPPTAVPHK